MIRKYLVIVYLFILNIFTLSVSEINDITFVVISDTHYGFGDQVTVNRATINYLNTFPGSKYPTPYGGGVVDTFRGVCVLGDLTENGRLNQWEMFIDDWGVNGEKLIKFPVYEGWGNHDGGPFISNRDYTAKGIKERTKSRKNLCRVSQNGFHYSWDWDNVHFVQLNRYISQNDKKAGNSLEFLIEDLDSSVGTSGRPVILMQHYGFDNWSIGKWWSVEETNTFYAAVKDYNVIAVFNGHTHSMEHIRWNGIDTYSAGSTKGWGPEGGTCLVVHIKDQRMRIFGLTSKGWRGSNYMWEKTFDNGSTIITRKKKQSTSQIVIVYNRKLILKSQENISFNLTIFDIRGRVVITKTASANMIINLGNCLPSGTYYYDMTFDNGKQRGQFCLTD